MFIARMLPGKGRRARCENDGLQPPRAPKSGRPVENSGRGDGVYLFTSDFLLAEADVWRREAWEMIRLRRDLHFMFLPSVSTGCPSVCPGTGVQGTSM